MKVVTDTIKAKGRELKGHINGKMALMLAGNLLTILINVATVKLLTNKFSVGDFGIYSLVISFTVLPQLVLFAPIAASIFPFIKNRKDENRYDDFQKDLFDLFFLIVFGLLLILIIGYLFNQIFHLLPDGIIYLVFLSVLFSTTMSWLAMLDTFSLANFKIKAYTLFPIINLVLKLFGLFAVFRLTITPQSLILLFSLIQLLFCFVELYALKNNGTITCALKVKLADVFSINSASKKQIINYSKNFLIWGLFGWAQTFLDKWVLNHYNGSSTVGIYAVYYQYGFFPFTIFSSIISQYITPIFFSKIDNNQNSFSFLRRLLIYSIFFLIVFCISMAVLAYYIAPFFIRIFTNAHYLEYIHLFPIIVLAGCFYGFGQIITVPLLNSDFVGRIRFPKIATAIIAVILFWILIPIFGFGGILYSLLLSNMFYFFSLLVINFSYLRNLKIQLNQDHES